MGFFPADQQTLDYLTMIGKPAEKVKMIEAYLRAQGLFREYGENAVDPTYSPNVMELDMSTVEPCLSGPKRPHDRVPLANMQKDFLECMAAPAGFKGFGIEESHRNT